MPPKKKKTSKPILAACIMVKNEKQRIHVTLNSLIGHVDKLIILDTGSSDSTIEIIKTFCEDNKMEFELIEKPFVDFSTSRNYYLDHADSKADWLLLLDCNDELRGGEALRKFIDEFNGYESAFMISQQWLCGHDVNMYANIRLLKTNHDWRYSRRVHEYLSNKQSTLHYERKPAEDPKDNYECIENNETKIIAKNPSKEIDTLPFCLYQDRNADDDKSFKRFKRDKVLLYEDHIDMPNDGRSVFYLAQTCACLTEWEESYKYYRLRTNIIGGYYEERFVATYKLGDLSEKMGYPWEESMVWYTKAFELLPRVEPLVKMAEHYLFAGSFHTAYMYCNQAINLNEAKCSLYSEKVMHSYTRYHQAGYVGHRIGRFDEGKFYCLKAYIERPGKVEEDILVNYLNPGETIPQAVEAYKAYIKRQEDQQNQQVKKETKQKQISDEQYDAKRKNIEFLILQEKLLKVMK